MQILEYSIIAEKLAVCRLTAGDPVPPWARAGGFLSVTRTGDELSIVCEEHLVPEGALSEKGFVALKLHGPFPFSMTGVLESFIQPLAESRISIFAVSTFDTDYVLVKRDSLERARAVLRDAGHKERE